MDGAHHRRQGRHPDPARGRAPRCPTTPSPPRRPAPGTAPPSGSPADRLPGHLGVPVDADHRGCTSAATATSSRTPATILSRANQALATLERYKLRLDEVSSTLSALEIEDLVGPSATSPSVAQRLEMVTPHRPRDRGLRASSSAPTAGCCPSSSRSSSRGVGSERALVIRDYLPGGRPPAAPEPVLDAAWTALVGHRAARPRRASRSVPGPARQRRRARRRRRARAATACWPRSRACPAPSSTAWSTTSAACRSCSRPASTTCRRSTASASRARRSVREGLSRLAESTILERYV